MKWKATVLSLDTSRTKQKHDGNNKRLILNVSQSSYTIKLIYYFSMDLYHFNKQHVQFYVLYFEKQTTNR